MNRLLSCLALLAFLAVSRSSDAATYYVNFNAGNNSSAGTSANPWKTAPGMNGSLANSKTVSPGDIVYFAPGQVWGATITGSGAASGLLTTVGGVTYKADTAVYNPDGAPAGTKAILRATGHMSNGIVQFRDHPTQETVIDNLDLDGNNQITQGVDMNHRYVILPALDGAWKKILNCYIHDMLGNMAGSEYKYGITARTNVENIWIENTEVYNPPREAIVMYSDNGTHISNVIIRHCLVHGDSSDGQPRGSVATGQYLNGSGYCLKGDVRNALIEHCTAYNIRSQAMFIFNNDQTGSSPTNFVIRHNVFHSSGHSGNGGTGVVRVDGALPKTGDFYGNIVLHCDNLSSNPGIYKTGSGTWTGNIYNNTVMVNNGSAIDLQSFSGNIRNNYVRGSITGSGTKSNNVTGAYTGFKNASNLPIAAFFSGAAGSYAPSRDGLKVVSGSLLNTGANLGTSYNGTIDSGVREGGSSAWDIGAYDTGATGGGGGNPDVTGPVISSLSGSSPSSTTAYVAFSTNESATAVIDYGTSPGVYTLQAVISSLNTSFNQRLVSLSPATTYYARVTATDGSANSTPSSEINFTTLALPTAPSPMTAAAAGATQINLGWANVSGETGYSIERSTSSLTGFIPIATPAANVVSLADQALNASTTYYYKGRSYVTRDGTTDYSAYTATVNATTSSAADVTAPVVSNVSAPSGSSTTHYVQWSTNESATGYVEYGPTAGYGSQTATSALLTSHNHRITGLSPGLYHYNIVTTDASSNTTPAVDRTFTVLALPATPTSLTATAASDTQINLGWVDNATGEGAYYVERSLVGSGSGFGAPIATLGSNATGYTDSGRASSTEYFYRVRCAIVRDGLTDYSAYSAEASDTTDPSGPAPDTTPPVISDAAAEAGSSKSVTVTCTTDEPAIVTLNYGPTAAYGATSGGTALGTSHSIHLTGYEALQNVAWRLNAVDAAGNAAPVRPTGSLATLAWPTAPTSFTATPVTNQRIDLTWEDNASGEDGYRIWRSTVLDDDNAFVELTTTGPNVTSYSDTTGAASTTYYYRLRTIITRDDIEDRSELAEASGMTLATQTSGVKPSRRNFLGRILQWFGFP